MKGVKVILFLSIITTIINCYLPEESNNYNKPLIEVEDHNCTQLLNTNQTDIEVIYDTESNSYNIYYEGDYLCTVSEQELQKVISDTSFQENQPIFLSINEGSEDNSNCKGNMEQNPQPVPIIYRSPYYKSETKNNSSKVFPDPDPEPIVR